MMLYFFSLVSSSQLEWNSFPLPFFGMHENALYPFRSVTTIMFHHLVAILVNEIYRKSFSAFTSWLSFYDFCENFVGVFTVSL